MFPSPYRYRMVNGVGMIVTAKRPNKKRALILRGCAIGLRFHPGQNMDQRISFVPYTCNIYMYLSQFILCNCMMIYVYIYIYIYT